MIKFCKIHIQFLFSSYTENLRDGCWSPTRPSVFFTARQVGLIDYSQKSGKFIYLSIFLSFYLSNIYLSIYLSIKPSIYQTIYLSIYLSVCLFSYLSIQDGVLDTWDILYQQRTPILSTKIADDALNCVKVIKDIKQGVSEFR